MSDIPWERRARPVRIAEPIKSVGSYPVTVRLHSDVSADITVVVDAEGGLPVAEGEAEAAEGDAAEAGEAGVEASGETDAAQEDSAASA